MQTRRPRDLARALVGSARVETQTRHEQERGGKQEDEEADMLDKAFDVRADSRLGCQSKILKDGEIEVEITRESLEAYENEHPQFRGKYTKRAG